jgi:hypothetical protein
MTIKDHSCTFRNQQQPCQWFFPGPPVTSTNKTDHHNIIEIMLKVALNTIKQTKPYSQTSWPLISPYLTTDITLFNHCNEKKISGNKIG